MEQRYVLGVVVLLALLLGQERVAVSASSHDDLEMKVKGVTMDPYGKTPIVILEDTEGHQAFPIWIGLPEAQAISRSLEGVVTPRPMTHTLLQNILGDLQVDIARIVIHDLQGNTFYATIVLRYGAKTIPIDARPSDAIALALGVKAPIFVSKKVLGSVRTVTLAVPTTPQSPIKKFGMHLQSLDANLAGAFHLSTTDGVLVASVEGGSQADKYGMRRGDVITDADGTPIKDVQMFVNMLRTKKGGQSLELQVLRDQQVHTIRLVLDTAD
jgi:hypothetical protein